MVPRTNNCSILAIIFIPRVLKLLNLSEIPHCNQKFKSQLARPSN